MRCFRSVKMLWLIMIGIVLFAGVKPVNSQESGDKIVKLEGWQKAKFGMSIEQVKLAYPAATIDQSKNLFNQCAKQHGVKVYPDGIGIEETPMFSCDGLVMTFSGERDSFDVNFDFERRSNKLVRIELKKKSPDEGAYEYYKQVLSGKYGVGREELTNEGGEGWCHQLEMEYDSSRLTLLRIMSAQQVKSTQFSLSNGQVVLAIGVPQVCDFFFTKFSREYRATVEKEIATFKFLRIIFINKPSISMTEKENF